MGERAGYRIKGKEGTSPILRKQWFVGDDEKTLHIFIHEVAQTLCDGGQIDSGMCALRHDLDVGRLSLAVYHVLYSPPFDSMEFDTNCDISDHGLYEIELVKWNHWKLNHYTIPFLLTEKDIDSKDWLDEASKKRYKQQLKDKDKSTLLADIKFTSDKSLSDGMKITWHLPEDEETLETDVE